MIAASLIALSIAGADAAQVFDTVAPAVFQILLETEDGDILSTGSGFFVGSYGDALSAFHVVDDVVIGGETLRLIAIVQGKRSPIEVVAVDPELDIALLRIDGVEPERMLTPVVGLPIGTGVFSLGRPADTGITIVQGTYRGENSSGFLSIGAALAPGMSGGPTVDAGGAVMGINVAKGPDVVGQVAPITAAMTLAKKADKTPGLTAFERLEVTVLEYQRAVRDHVQSSTITTTLLDFDVPAPSPCRTINPKKPDPRWTLKSINCVWSSSVFLARDYTIGEASVQYVALENRSLFGPRFWSQVRDSVGLARKTPPKNRVREPRCETKVVALGSSLHAKLVFCSREHVLFAGLHDFYVSGVTIDHSDKALIIDLTLLGYTPESAKLITGAMLRGIRSKKND